MTRVMPRKLVIFSVIFANFPGLLLAGKNILNFSKMNEENIFCICSFFLSPIIIDQLLKHRYIKLI